MLNEAEIPSVQYHGGVKDSQREDNIDAFQSRRARAFVAVASSGGIGLTLTAATTVIYYSQSYDLDERLQSEDRAHRKGTTKNVVYIDLVAEETIDEEISRSLQSKNEVATLILDGYR